MHKYLDVQNNTVAASVEWATRKSAIAIKYSLMKYGVTRLNERNHRREDKAEGGEQEMVLPDTVIGAWWVEWSSAGGLLE